MTDTLYLFASDGYFWGYHGLGARLEVAIVGAAEFWRGDYQLIGPVGRLNKPIAQRLPVGEGSGEQTDLVLLDRAPNDPMAEPAGMVTTAVAYPLDANADPWAVKVSDLWPSYAAKVIITNDGDLFTRALAAKKPRRQRRN